MVEIGIDVVGDANIESSRFWGIVWNLLVNVSVHRVCPIVCNVRNVRVVGFIDAYANGPFLEFGEVATNPLDSF